MVRLAVVWLNGHVMGFNEKGHYEPPTDDAHRELTPKTLLQYVDTATRFELWVRGIDGDDGIVVLTRHQWKLIADRLAVDRVR